LISVAAGEADACCFSGFLFLGFLLYGLLLFPGREGDSRDETSRFKVGSPTWERVRVKPIIDSVSMPRLHRMLSLTRWCLLGLAACAVAPAHGWQTHSSYAYTEAVRLRAALERQPARDRSQAEYERVLNAYRAVYHGEPGSMHAAASVYAVGSLLTEYGQVFHDPKASRDAIGQFEFLRKQYPGSSYRVLALLDEGEIYERDLHEDRAAQTKLKLFLRLYPQSPMASEARYALADTRRDEGNRETAAVPLRSRSFVKPKVKESQPPVHRPSSAQAIPPPAMERPAKVAALTSPRPAMVVHPRMASTTVPQSFHGPLPLVTSIRHWSTPNYTRVAINLQQEVRYEASRETNPDRIDFDLYGARLSPQLNGRSSEIVDNGFLKQIHLSEQRPGVAQIELHVSPVSDYYAFYLPDPPRLIIDVHGRAPDSEQTTELSNRVGYPGNLPAPVRTYAAPVEHAAVPGTNAAARPVHPFRSAPPVLVAPAPTTRPVAAEVAGTRPAPPVQRPVWRTAAHTSLARRAAKPSAATPLPAPLTSMQPEVPGSPAIAPPLSATAPTMVRALGLKINRIVIDAGHGGHDSGAIGPNGLEEKTVALDVALRLGRLLKQRLGADVIYTRDTDRFIPLETRTAIANQDRADLFISVHVNSSPDTAARGVATYYLSFTSSADALQLAARENAVSNESIHQLSDLVKKIALSDKINESRDFAEDVDRSLYRDLAPVNGPGFENRGVHKAPFVVLIGANMPSILAEISFISNSKSAHLLTEPAYRERIAQALYQGVAKYVGTLNGLRLAQNGGTISAN
jgi:N-acetylmuramoyl-L-alanine amidase